MRGRTVVAIGGAWLGVVAGLVAALGAWASGGRPVSVRLFQFQPALVEVPAGSRVTWTNADDIEHTVTSGTPDRPRGRFEARLPGRGATAELAFTEPGVHDYFCERHPAMRGQVRVP
jgi:plastocyanin